MDPAGVLTEIGSRMSSVVDPDLRARLTQRYLGLLKRWQGYRRVGDKVNVTDRRFVPELKNLFMAVQGGQAAYKLTPALGTINDRFNNAYIDAMASIDRLAQMTDAQKDVGLKTRWRAELRDLRGMLNHYRNQAEVSSANANLSQIDALANLVQQYTAMQLMGREVEWARKLGLGRPRYKSRGTSGLISRQARPDLWFVRGRKYGWGRRRGTGAAGNYVTRPAGGLGSDLVDSLTQFATSLWSGVTDEVKQSADQTYSRFERAVERAGQARKRHDRHRVLIENVRAADPQRAADLDLNLDDRKARLANAVATLRKVSDGMKGMTFDKWDDPGRLVTQHLGGLDSDKRAVTLLYAADIGQADALISEIERDDAKFESDVTGLTPGVVAAGGGLALAAIGVGAYLLARKRR
jgi:hypothetical protein